MEFDETKKIDVEISENEFVENRVAPRKKFSLKGKDVDLLDIAIIPVAIGVFISLGFLFASLFGQVSGSVSSVIDAIM